MRLPISTGSVEHEMTLMQHAPGSHIDTCGCAGVCDRGCPAAAALITGRTALARACCSRWDGDAGAALEQCTAGLAALKSFDASGGGVCGGVAPAWAAADLVLQLQLQQANCHAVLVRNMWI